MRELLCVRTENMDTHTLWRSFAGFWWSSSASRPFLFPFSSLICGLRSAAAALWVVLIAPSPATHTSTLHLPLPRVCCCCLPPRRSLGSFVRLSQGWGGAGAVTRFMRLTLGLQCTMLQRSESCQFVLKKTPVVCLCVCLFLPPKA